MLMICLSDRVTRQRELISNKNQKGTYHFRIMPGDVFGFAEHQERASYGLGYKLKLTRNSDNSVLNKALKNVPQLHT